MLQEGLKNYKRMKKENEFVMVARYHEEKGIDKVIKAMEIVKNRVLKLSLIFMALALATRNTSN